MIQVFLTLTTNRLLDIHIIYNTKFVQKNAFTYRSGQLGDN